MKDAYQYHWPLLGHSMELKWHKQPKKHVRVLHVQQQQQQAQAIHRIEYLLD